MGLKILFAGQTVPGSRTLQRIRTLRELGHGVEVISTNIQGATYKDKPGIATRIRYRLGLPADPARANATIMERGGAEKYDVVWLDRAVEIHAATLRSVKSANPDTKIVWYAEDDMMNPLHRSRWIGAALSLFDLWVTTKSFNAAPEELPSLGVRRILFVNNSFDPEIHRPQTISEQDQKMFGTDVGFVGSFEEPRTRSMRYLAEHGINIRIWGNGWDQVSKAPASMKIENRPVYNEDYGKVVCSTSVNLCFLRRGNRDLQTCRSMEIPAFGGLMMHERNGEITELFCEDEEAVFFDTDEELLSKCRKWLADHEARDRVGRATREAVIAGGHSHPERLGEILTAALDGAWK